ncbi:unnamed protein product [Pleuronectes platessa]|uniref:Uncharacterized protein n=1 Tax=Pleuronectes platessa TaxID=8262 RepID=A0A9N7TWD8_PLEPL|nr:unnamed protein product [Pleuronectes platessa]
MTRVGYREPVPIWYRFQYNRYLPGPKCNADFGASFRCLSLVFNWKTKVFVPPASSHFHSFLHGKGAAVDPSPTPTRGSKDNILLKRPNAAAHHPSVQQTEEHPACSFITEELIFHPSTTLSTGQN